MFQEFSDSLQRSAFPSIRVRTIGAHCTTHIGPRLRLPSFCYEFRTSTDRDLRF
jgi:hypothetical protein